MDLVQIPRTPCRFLFTFSSGFSDVLLLIRPLVRVSSGRSPWGPTPNFILSDTTQLLVSRRRTFGLWFLNSLALLLMFYGGSPTHSVTQGLRPLVPGTTRTTRLGPPSTGPPPFSSVGKGVFSPPESVR